MSLPTICQVTSFDIEPNGYDINVKVDWRLTDFDSYFGVWLWSVEVKAENTIVFICLLICKLKYMIVLYTTYSFMCIFYLS